MADDEYVEGDSNSAAADAPGAIPTDDAPSREATVAIDATIDSSSVHDAPVQRLPRSTARNQSARKAFAEAIAASKANPPKVNEDLEDPEDVALAAPTAPTVEPVVAAAAVPSPAVEPPAPSLHPEVIKLKQQLVADREAFEAEKAAAKKAAEPAPLPDAASLEDYIDNAPRAYRTWLESMRGEKFATDDEFKTEVKDFITAMSTDVLGVPLPDNIRAQFDAAQAKKIVRTHKTIQAKQQAAQAARQQQERATADAKAEADRVEHEWTAAADALGKQFAPQSDVAGKPVASQTAAAYPWLAAEDEPGKIIVDVIRAALTRDGTQLSWQEASKKANDYLAEQAKRYYDKRRPLLASASAPAPAPVAAKPKPVVAAAPAAPVAPAPAAPAEPKTWNRDKHMESSKAAFRQMIGKPTT